jgi:AraC-like DNA-binding protein
VQEVGEFKVYPPYYTERSGLDSFLILATKDGEGTLEYEGEVYHCLPGTVFFINCQIPHKYYCPSGKTWEFSWIHLNGSSALGYYEEFANGGTPLRDNFGAEAFQEILDFLAEILDKTRNPKPQSELLVSEKIVALLTRLLLHNTANQTGCFNLTQDFKMVLGYIEKHYAEELSLDLLAKLCNRDKYYFSKQFKKYMDISPGEYVIMTRLNHGKELLKYSELTVEEIAFSCGFHQSSHFIRLFQARMKMTPLQYRKKWGNCL